MTAEGLETSGRRHSGRLGLMHPLFEEAKKLSGDSHICYLQKPRTVRFRVSPTGSLLFHVASYRSKFESVYCCTGHQTPGRIRDPLDNSPTGGYLHIISTCRSSWRHSVLQPPRSFLTLQFAASPPFDISSPLYRQKRLKSLVESKG